MPVLARALVLVALTAVCACDKAGAAPTQTPSGTAAPTPGPVVGRLVPVVAGAEGYEPSKIEAKAGEELTLRFTRKTKSECLAEVMFPSLGIKKALPMDAPVDIHVKADKPGEIKFSCGMAMVFGSIVVQ